jgi:microcystin-dependent protein
MSRLIAKSGGVPAGTIIDFAGTVPPSGYLNCDGSNISRTVYAGLFIAIGETWGVGDGLTTFGLPDLRRSVTVGSGGVQVSGPANTVGSTGGAETHTLSTSQLANHAHSHTNARVLNGAGVSDFTGGGAYLPTTMGNSTGSNGSGSSHNNMQPSAVVTKAIKT